MADHEFEVVASETAFVGGIFAVRADEVRMPGGTTARREVVEHYGAVAIVALDEAGNVVLVHQYRHPVARRLWELPAGLLDMGDEPPHLSAARELEEEVGLAADTWHVLVDVIAAPGFADESVRVFLATGLTDVGRPEAHHEEADLTVCRVPLPEAVDMVFAGEIVNSLAVAGILAAHNMPEVATLRPVDAPWRDRPTRFQARKASGASEATGESAGASEATGESAGASEATGESAGASEATGESAGASEATGDERT